MKKKILLVLSLLMFIFVLGCNNKGTTEKKDVGEKIVVKDIMGEEIILDKVAERIFLGFYMENYLAISKDFNFERVISMSKGETRDLLNSLWKVYADAIPELDKLVDTGSIYGDTFSMEKLIETKPDLAIIAPFQYDKLGENVDKLRNMGVQVAVVDFNSLTLEKHIESTMILGKLLGTEERAEEIASNYKKQVEEVKNRVANVEANRKVYVELGRGGGEVYGNSYGNVMWGSLVNQAKGKNIAMGIVEKYAPLSPEYLLSENPEIIIFSGSTAPKTDKKRFRMGFGISNEESRESAEQYIGRTGWERLSAVKNKEVYGVDHGSLRTMYDYVFLQYIAKAIHPELFEDINPEKNHSDYYEKYLPVNPQGTFMIRILEDE